MKSQFDEPPSVDDLNYLRTSAIVRLSLLSGALRGRNVSLDWLTEMSVKQLTVWAPGHSIPELPKLALAELESLTLLGKSKKPLRGDYFPRLRYASVDIGQIEGPLSDFSYLEVLVLGAVRDGSLNMISGCRKLKSVSIEIARGVRVREFDLRTDVPPVNLEILDIQGAGVSSLQGVESLPNLEEIVVNHRGRKRLDNIVDLAPLATCRKLRRVILYYNGDLVNADVLTTLPALERVMAVRGHILPPLPLAPWLHTFG
ncbi:hypothetical protein EUA98_16835 [Pengzhenrongella frigida]|uniref:Leucine-rich repeat domain-containing protein n=1 Tax=Pengzhenrongella frigida TaxID=1259133 RepID=A0A4Q5N193_9MICO|nr:hypothetical protein EUA98_16835 [Cellulomonas sp. HLT2-17]